MKIERIFLILALLLLKVNVFSQLPGNALSFDGINEHVPISNSPSLNINNNQVTVEAWVLLNTLPADIPDYFSGIFDSLNDSYVLYLDRTNNELRFKVTTSSGVIARPGISAADLYTDRWMHIVGTYDGNTNRAKIYLNGVLKDTEINATLNGNVLTGQSASIGNETTSNSRFFSGLIDELRIWNVYRTQEQIQANMYNELTGTETGLVAYYNFNETSGNVVHDLVNLNNGIAQNMENEDWVESYAMVVPQNLTTTECGLSWSPPYIGIAEKYYLEIATDSNFVNKVPGYNPYSDMSSNVNYYYNDLTIGNSYYARVRAYKNTVGDVGAYSNSLLFIASKDNTPPNAPTLAMLSGCAVTASTPTTTDNCVGTVIGTTNNPTVYTAPGTYTITWTFADGHGNNTTAGQTVTITAPPSAVWTLPTNLQTCSGLVNLNTTISGTTGGTWSGIGVSGSIFTPSSVPAGNYSVTYTVGSGTCQTSSTQIINVAPCQQVLLKICLQGPYNSSTGSMNTTLRTGSPGLIPLAQPYTTAPWNYSGTEAFATINDLPTNSVDWVLVELRHVNSGALMGSKAGMLLADGSVINTSGSTGLYFNVSAGNYTIVIRHRNHLAVFSANAVSIPTTSVFDATVAANISGGTNQLANLGAEQYGLLAGDYNSNGIINYQDYNVYMEQFGQTNQYNIADGNLNRSVANDDFDVLQPNIKHFGGLLLRY